MALLEALAGSMIDSAILVTVRSRFAGKKFFTPEIKFSKLAPTPVSFKEEVRREDMLLKPRKSSVDVEAWVGAEDGVEVIIVIRVVARTLVKVSINLF
jgi:hypothetical protein